MPKRGLKGPVDFSAFGDGTFKRLLSYLKPYRGKLILVIFCIIISSVSGVASSLFIKTLIDEYITPMLTVIDPSFAPLAKALLVMCMIYAAGLICGFTYNRTMAVLSQRILKDIRDSMFEHMQTLPIKYFDQRTHGEVMSYYTNDTDTLRQLLSQTLPQLISSVLTMVVVLGSMIHLSIWLTLVAIATAIVAIIIAKTLAGKSGKYFIAQQKNLASMNGYIEEMVGGQKVVKVFNHEEKAREEFAEKNEALRESSTKANMISVIIMPIMGNFGHILYVIFAIAGGALAIKGIPNISVGGPEFLTLGTIASFLTLSRSFMNPISQVSQQLSSVVMALAGAKRIFALLDEPSEEDHGTVSLVQTGHESWVWRDEEGNDTPVKGRIDLKDVDFGYVDDTLVLHDINIYAEPGQKIALVGHTGAGKTTITNLINRFYDINDGEIYYDGIDISKIKKVDLRKSLGVVLQDVNLFTDTVLENIRYGRLDATDEECIAAAKLAGADSFIRMLKNGYDTVLEGDGSGLSQGQRQLISIARAAVADPPVMILDEATSSIDTRTESIVQKGMDNLMKGRTVFVIAHRLSTVQNSDVIMVMENGRIIERGNHEQLIAEKGKYYQLYTGAFELE